jgi:hypothetical protein
MIESLHQGLTRSMTTRAVWPRAYSIVREAEPFWSAPETASAVSVLLRRGGARKPQSSVLFHSNWTGVPRR